ncbi:MAG: hypothetical protein ABGY41_05740 [Candidatus Poribacteria bacterium]
MGSGSARDLVQNHKQIEDDFADHKIGKFNASDAGFWDAMDISVGIRVGTPPRSSINFNPFAKVSPGFAGGSVSGVAGWAGRVSPRLWRVFQMPSVRLPPCAQPRASTRLSLRVDH